MSQTKPQIARLAFIDGEIRKRGFPNASTLAKAYEVSAKTIARDIDFLKFEMKAPIAYDPVKHGYFYTEPTYRLQPLEVTESDLFALCIAEKALKQYEQTPLYPKLKAIFDRIAAQLPGTVSIQLPWVNERVSFIGEHPRTIDPAIWDAVAEALRAGRRLHMVYKTPRQTEPGARDIDPYHLAAYRGDWYLIGHDHKSDELRTFAVSRIKSVKMLASHFDVPADFNAAEALRKRFGIIDGDRTYNVRIHVSADQAPYLLERTWHPEQKLKHHGDGSVVLAFPTSNLYEVKFWVLTWGRAAKVLAPRELIDAVREELEATLQNLRS
ncbi:MAG: helix-turn-helix transcriptional regulator [Planctomycetota bacterium]